MIIEFNQLLAFFILFGVLTISIGPDTMLVVRNVMWNKSSDGIATAIGACTGCFAHAALSAFGLSAILLQSAVLFRNVKILGALYLAWLGIQALRRALYANRAKTKDLNTRSLTRAERNWKICFREGIVSNLLNPKTSLFYISVLPQFIYPEESALQKSLFLAALHFLMAVTWLSLVALIVSRLHSAARSGVVQRWLDGLSGVVLIGMAIRFFADRKVAQL